MKRRSLAQLIPALALRIMPAIVIGIITLLLAAPSLYAEPAAPTPPAPIAVMIQLEDKPAAVVYAARRQQFAAELAHNSTNGQVPSPSAAQAAEPSATAAAQAQLATITAVQAALQQRLAALDTPVLYTVQRVYNGVAVLADESQQEAIRNLPGVLDIHPLIAKTPTNSLSVPYLGIPSLWSGAPGIVEGVRGEGMRIAIIDTGIDYLHRDFGGPGTGYLQNDRTLIGDVEGFPGTRVVGGYDFVGDDYNASSDFSGMQATPRPDQDPMDCYGHGTHVAGTAAGSGVTADRRTYNGPYTSDTDFDSMHIGPGIAPRASIYALKIFGCYGSTNVTELALEWTVDPNGDGDFGDRMDVVNMSLGSAYGWPYDTSAVAADNAALAGVIVVASAGNNGDVQFITSAPASADRAISVAATQHVDDFIASFSSRGPRRTEPTIKPDLAAPGAGIVSAYNGSGTERASSSGTSMAAPHVAGMMVLLRQLHPDWSVEELKALAMNTAMPLVGRDTGVEAPSFLPVRIGGGRAAPVEAARATSVLYAAGGSGRVGLSFGSPPVSGIYAATQEIVIANKATAAAAFDLTYSSLVGLPGVEVRVPQARVEVAAGASVRVPVTLEVDTAAYERRQAPVDVGAYLVDNWLAEEGGHLYAWPPAATTDVALRTPQGASTAGDAAAAPSAAAEFAYDGPKHTLGYTVTLSGFDASRISSATLGYGREVDASVPVADLFPQLETSNILTGSLVLDDSTERQLAAGLLHLRLTSTALAGGEVRGQLVFKQPVLHLPVYAAPRPTAQMRSETQSLNYMTDTVGTIELAGQPLQGSSPPTQVVSLASVFELKLRSPNTRPSWLDPNGPDRFDHADIRYVGVTSDLAQSGRQDNGSAQGAVEPMLYFGVATWRPWTTPSEVRINVWLDVDGDSEYEYRLANNSPIAAIFGMGPGGPLTSELYDGPSGMPLAQQPLNGIEPQRFDSNPFFNSVMVLPVRLADMELPDTGGRIRFMIQTISFDTAGSGVRFVDQTPIMHYNIAQPALTFSAPGAADPAYLDQPDTAIGVTFQAAGHSYSPALGVLILHHHNDGLAQATTVGIEARSPFRLFMPIVREQATP